MVTSAQNLHFMQSKKATPSIAHPSTEVPPQPDPLGRSHIVLVTRGMTFTHNRSDHGGAISVGIQPECVAVPTVQDLIALEVSMLSSFTVCCLHHIDMAGIVVFEITTIHK